MTSLTIEKVKAVFDRIIEPKLKWNLNTLGLVKNIEINQQDVNITINLITTNEAEQEQVKHACISCLKEIGCKEINLTIGQVNVATVGVKGIKKIILVGSGKGGVGKSSVAVNFALGLSLLGNKVGLLDADLYGPSMPRLLNVTEKPEVLGAECLQPIEVNGIKTMSVGYLIKAESALDWRGQMVSGTILQFLHKTNWGELDYLVVDLPPGTGDIHLTIMHQVKCDGVILITTPSQLALDDVKRSIDMYKSRNIPILGIIENMSKTICEHCKQETTLGKKSNGAETELDLPYLAKLPLDFAFRDANDLGKMPILATPQSPICQAIKQVAQDISNELSDNSANFADSAAEQIA